MARLDFYGEVHTPGGRSRIEWLIIDNHRKDPYKFLLSEELGPYRHMNEVAIKQAIADNLNSISSRSLKLALKLGIPAIGIDRWEKKTYSKDKIDEETGGYINAKHSFKIREEYMVEVISEFARKGNCAIIVGDTHLRTTATKELGPPSPIWEKWHRSPNATFYRSPRGEIK